MKLQAGTKLYVVELDSLTEMPLGNFLDALAGGLNLQKVGVFTEEDEAKEARRANERRLYADKFSQHELLAAAKIVLVDKDGKAIREYGF